MVPEIGVSVLEVGLIERAGVVPECRAACPTELESTAESNIGVGNAWMVKKRGGGVEI